MFEALAVGYRATLFALGGLSEFTKQGFLNNSKAFTPGALDVDLKGRTILVTGANSGLGYAAATQFAQRGATVHLLCRDEGRGKKAQEEIVAATGSKTVHLQTVDVSSVSSIKAFIAKWKDAPVHALINNAGILPATRVETKDGLESTFATNTLGTYALTELLLPALAKAEDARVVNVTSGGAFNKGLDASDVNSTKIAPTSFNGSIAYAQTKRAQIELTEYWAKKHPSIFFVSMHPGWSDTPGVQTSLPGFYNSMKDRLRTADQGADTIVWAAIAKEAREKIRSGALLFDRKEVAQHVTLGGTQAKEGEMEKLVDICAKYLKDL